MSVNAYFDTKHAADGKIWYKRLIPILSTLKDKNRTW